MTRQNPTKYLSDAERQEVIESYVRHSIARTQANRKWRRETALKYGVDGHEISKALHPRQVQEELDRSRKKREENSAEWRKERRSIVETLLLNTSRVILNEENGGYGEGGWHDAPNDINESELVEFVLDVMEFERSVR